MASKNETVAVKAVPTKPIDGQKTGTSGLRKKTELFMSDNYLANWVQSLFTALGSDLRGKSLGLGGDGRYFNREAVQIILRLAAGNGVGRVVVGKEGIMATPAMSATIRRRSLYGGLIMSASHNPAGPKEDWGIKFNWSGGEPAPEKITDRIFVETQQIKELQMADIPAVDLSKLGVKTFKVHGPDGSVSDFVVEVVDYTEDYFAALKEVFDFEALRRFVAHPKFSMTYDALWAVTGAYARPLFVDLLGADPQSLQGCTPKEDFGGGHPDPNLTYAADLVKVMTGEQAPEFGAASDGDGDRNMILGSKFFVTPSDSVAVLAAHAQRAIPYFNAGLKGVARSMPTSGALDLVAKKLNIPFYETPTGWKFFGNLMDAGRCSICGEESFGTGADHVREKDGLWAVLAWLSVLAQANEGRQPADRLLGVRDVVEAHWREYGRNFYARHDYEGVESEAAGAMMEHLRGVIAESKKGDVWSPKLTLATADDFEYTDPIDGSVAKGQGIRFVFQDGSRIVFRLSGTGSAGATIRLYLEQFSDDQTTFDKDAHVMLKDIADLALAKSKLQHFTKRDKPTVIT
ncbi:hypothetical protein H632_c1323p0 [Helicosporidium sp. ATCC 50920]|nr:hypothetical protein H632_c1323p0 [Helicosporidium sp. ATCC 50920]|eukprot:KDD74424.1 hypothetical protein H632_c1323p0 [Helicosporidium sp. ATCC 50920]